MKGKKRNIVEGAMHYRQIVILLTCCLMAVGIFGLSEMKKNEFPDFTIRQGIVAYQIAVTLASSKPIRTAVACKLSRLPKMQV